MEVRYQRELNENYLILEDENPGDEYSVRMMEENEIPGFLKMKRTQIDQRWSFRYEISGRQSVQKILERRPASAEELHRLFSGIASALQTMEKYLLPLDGVRLEPEFIYIKPDFTGLLLCYHPGNAEGFFVGVRRLTQYFLNKIDHADKESVEIAYGMFRISSEDDFGFRDLMQVFEEEEELPDGMDSEEECKEKNPAKRSEFYDRKTMKDTGIAGQDKNNGMDKKKEWERKTDAESYTETDRDRIDLWDAEESLPEYLTEKKSHILPILVPAGGILTVILLYFLGFLDRFPAGIRYLILIGSLPVFLLIGFLLYRWECRPDPVWEDIRKESFSLGGPATEILSEERTCAPTVSLISQNLLHHENLEITEFPWILGKVPGECTCLLESAVISRLHARMEYREDGLILYDLGSTNGTFVNQRRLKAGEACPLHGGDQISFADFAYLLQI